MHQVSPSICGGELSYPRMNSSALYLLRGNEVICNRGNNGGHHAARASKATMSKTADRVLGVHGFVTSCERLM